MIYGSMVHPGYGMPSGLQGMTGIGILGVGTGSGSSSVSHNDASIPSEGHTMSNSSFLPLALPGIYQCFDLHDYFD